MAVSDAVDRVREITGRDVNIGGYSQGGMFCYQTAAYRRSEGIDSIITFGSPVDTRGALPFGIPENVAIRGADAIAAIAGRQALPAWASRFGFRMMDPVKSFRSRVDFLMQLHNRDALLPRERQRRFLEGEGWVAWPGPALADFVKQFVAHNRMLQGGFVIEDRLVTLADIASPVLTFVGEVDEIAPPAMVRAVSRAAPRADIYELSLRAGHFGLVVGSTASRASWPVVAGWAHWRAGQGELPEGVVRVDENGAGDPERGGASAAGRAGYGLELVGGVGTGVARSALLTATRTVKTVRELSREAASQLPRLARLEQIQPGTRISLGQLLDEQTRKRPDDVCFLWEDRAFTMEAVNERIDNIVRGLASIGVRRGEHVGVLMGARPTALAIVTAISRIGAVAVLLRPDGDIAREVELGGVDRIVADPENADRAKGVAETHPFVLGGGGGPRDLGLGIGDMERIDPKEIELPAWYRPNPGLARDLAFITFTGEGERTRANRISNRRWALSAFGTATSAALTPSDTVYCVTPVHHPSGLLMSISGAIAGGARLAMTSKFEPENFWDEIRRYGVTIASYTWTLLHDVAEAPPHPNERHHPVRLFIGSGMPRGLWRRVAERFAPAQVLEFYAGTEGSAVLVNLSGQKPGSMGRRLPGSADVRIAAYDPLSGRLIEGSDGFVLECPVDEVGMLLARVGPGEAPTVSPLRGVFERDDAWLMTDDLFRRDADGDFWLVDHVSSLIPTADGLVAPGPIRDLLGDLPAVDLAVSYGVPVGDGDTSVIVAAVTLREGRELTAQDLHTTFAATEPDARPAIVHIVDEIPVTTWYRPLTAPLRKAGLPAAGKRAWYRDARGNYRQLTEAARKRLAAN